MSAQIPAIPMNELRISTYSPTVRSGFDLRTDSGCRITHLATRIEVSAEDERSIHKAKAAAMIKFEREWNRYWSRPALSDEQLRAVFEATPEMMGNFSRHDSGGYQSTATNIHFTCFKSGYQAGIASQAQQESKPVVWGYAWQCKSMGDWRIEKLGEGCIPPKDTLALYALPPAPEGDTP